MGGVVVRTSSFLVQLQISNSAPAPFNHSGELKPQVVSDQHSVPSSVSDCILKLIRTSCPLLCPDLPPGKGRR